MSSLTWVAHSEAERRRTLEVIRLLDEPGTVDDIGIGGIRDAFSGQLFPGTSVIQTRARYFLFTPWIYRELERKAPVADAQRRSRELEETLIEELIKSGGKGVIGRVAGKALKTPPSYNYWGSLHLWGIQRTNIGISAYHRRLERAHIADPGADGDTGGSLSAWHPELPDPPEGFPRGVGLDLTYEEGDYLRDRIMTSRPGTLLATLVGLQVALPDAAMPWELADFLAPQAPPEVLDQLNHARCFAEVIHGAQLLYNVILAEASDRARLVDEYRGSFEEWADRMVADRPRYVEWSQGRPAFWDQVARGHRRIRHRAQRFADTWFDLAVADDPHLLVDAPDARRLIEMRERELKGRLARLQNRTALEAWGGRSGAGMLDFRWGTVKTLVSDIVTPLVEFHSGDTREAGPAR